MHSSGMLENIYLRCLEIDAHADGTRNGLITLTQQLFTILEMIPDHIDPVENFEWFVLKRLCESTNHVVEAYLAKIVAEEIDPPNV